MLTTGKQVGFQSPSKLLWSNSWIAQTVRQWIPDCRTIRSEGTANEGVAADTWNSQLMAASGSQVPATGDIGHWNGVRVEISSRIIQFSTEYRNWWCFLSDPGIVTRKRIPGIQAMGPATEKAGRSNVLRRWRGTNNSILPTSMCYGTSNRILILLSAEKVT